MDQGIKSRPRYEPLLLDASGNRHLVVMDTPALPNGAFAVPPSGAELWTVAEGAKPPRSFATPALLLSALARRLATEAAGFRLYAVGTEAFIWDVEAVARSAGMAHAEVFLRHAGSLRRRIYCTHCKAMTDDVTTDIVRCGACGAALFVRDHFSRRLRAFMGVRVDAEDHGRVPPATTLYP